jgi:hypothetical protein
MQNKFNFVNKHLFGNLKSPTFSTIRNTQIFTTIRKHITTKQSRADWEAAFCVKRRIYFYKIFLQNIFTKYFYKIFLQNIFTKYFYKIFLQNIHQQYLKIKTLLPGIHKNAFFTFYAFRYQISEPGTKLYMYTYALMQNICETVF